MKQTLMLREILEQPDLLLKTSSVAAKEIAARGVAPRSEGRILLTGCGDMDFSARAAAGLFRLACPGSPLLVEARSSMELRWEDAGLGGKDLVIAASFSGRTPRTVEAALRAQRKGARVIGITGNARSPMAGKVDEIICLEAGPPEELDRHAYGGYHANVPQTKTFTAVLMAELQLLSRLAGDPGDWSTELARIPAALRHLIGDLPARIEAWTAGSFSGRESVVVLGSGPWRPAAMYGAAKFLEMAVPSRHQCMEEFNHLEVFLTGAETLVVFLCPDGPSLSRTVELVAPFERLGAQRLCLVASHLAGSVPASTLDGADILSVPCGGAEDGAGGAGGNRGVSAPSLFFAFAVALQFLAASIGPALGRDIDRWVGGVRTGLIEDLSQTTIRRSRIRDDDAFF